MISGGRGAPEAVGLGVDDPLDRVEHVGADLLVEGADVELEQRLVGDHVVLRAGLQRADRDDRGLAGGDLARDDRLQAQDGRGGHDDRVDAGLGHRAVGAAAEQPHLEAVGGGLRGAGPVADRRRRGRA